jgi:hypothetical protein
MYRNPHRLRAKHQRHHPPTRRHPRAHRSQTDPIPTATIQRHLPILQRKRNSTHRCIAPSHGSSLPGGERVMEPVIQRARDIQATIPHLILQLRASDIWSQRAEYQLNAAFYKIEEALEDMRLHDGLKDRYNQTNMEQ